MAASVRKIAVATVTRNRPLMLGKLLASYSRLSIPENVSVCFLIVENNDRESLGPIIEDFREKVRGCEVVYVLEPVLGIAAARNRAMQEAIDGGFDLLTFADDDEEVESDWLCELLKERDAQDLDIVGSPVRVAAPDIGCSRWSKIIWKAISAKNMGAERRYIDRRFRGRTSALRLATGSWMANLDFFRRTGLRFNTDLGLSGGEDWQLYDAAKSVGARTGWTPHAIAYESLPETRLRLRYYYRRDRDHARTVFRERYRKDPRGALLRLAGSLASRFYKIIVSMLLFPLNPGRSLLSCASHIGSSIGLVQGLLGIRSDHYSRIDGA